MSRIKTIIAFFAISLSSSALAQWEIEVHTGIAEVSSREPAIEGVQIMEWDTRDQASGIELRYQMANDWYLLLGYEDLGEGESRLLVESEQVFLAEDIAPTLVEGYTLGVGYTLWQMNRWNLVFRGGIYVWEAHTRSSLTNGDSIDDKSGTDLFYGVNINYYISEKFSTAVGYQGYTPETGHTDQFKVGITYHF
ncbi:hypothetical protein D210916BOD24_34080 [Alteromonas sp. D210916BOD_24]|uniref:outer membrane beta-barrel protein n=1 Tax=Alteromonas sp. D210916BOD_24 TaxID=3157618 RepID=UPI00399C743B